MNQFRDILIAVMVILAIGLEFGHPENWTWAAAGGSYAVNAVAFLANASPWSALVLIVLALALFITRLKY